MLFSWAHKNKTLATKPLDSLNFFFKRAYFWHLSEADLAKYYLIERYWKTLSYRLIREYNKLYIPARVK